MNIYCGYYYYFKKEIGKVYTSPIEVITETVLSFAHRNRFIFLIIYFYLLIHLNMFTLLYYILLQDARNVGLRIFAFSRI